MMEKIYEFYHIEKAISVRMSNSRIPIIQKEPYQFRACHREIMEKNVFLITVSMHTNRRMNEKRMITHAIITRQHTTLSHCKLSSYLSVQIFRLLPRIHHHFPRILLLLPRVLRHLPLSAAFFRMLLLFFRSFALVCVVVILSD